MAGITMFSFQKSKVWQLTSSVFCSSLCLFRRINYTLSVVSLGACGISYTKKNHYNFASLSCEKKTVVFLCQNLIMRCYVTILAGNLWRSDFFWMRSRINRTQSDPGFVNPVRSGPGSVNPIRSDPVWVL